MISSASKIRFSFYSNLHSYARRIQNYASNYARYDFMPERFYLMFMAPARQNIAHIVI